MLELKDAKPENPQLKVREVVVDGQSVGRIEPKVRDDGRVMYLASIRVGGALGPHAGLIFGHGSSPNEAIENAIERGRDDGQCYLEGVERFAAQVDANRFNAGCDQPNTEQDHG